MDQYAPRPRASVFYFGRSRALTLGELILLNRLRAEEQIRNAASDLAWRGRLRPYQPPPTGKLTMAPRVGFRGLKGYRQQAQNDLDRQADALADRIDKIKARGTETIGQHQKDLDRLESEIDEMDAMVREGSNGGPLGAS